MSQPNVIRILIADDYPILGQALTMFLECEPDITVVGYAGDGRKALELWSKHQPDVALMDLQMPKMEGENAIATICAAIKILGWGGDRRLKTMREFFVNALAF